MLDRLYKFIVELYRRYCDWEYVYAFEMYELFIGFEFVEELSRRVYCDEVEIVFSRG